MKLVIGLGNIGNEYERTRHNVGFICLDRFAQKHNLTYSKTKLYLGYTYQNCLFIKPKSYMNNSGDAYLSAQSKIGAIEDILVIVDDMYLPLGNMRIRTGGGDGGHNGLRSLISKMGSDNFNRLRIGIGKSSALSAKDHVLDRFSADEAKIIEALTDVVSDWLDLYSKTDIVRMLDAYSMWKRNSIPSEENGIIRPKEENNDQGL